MSLAKGINAHVGFGGEAAYGALTGIDLFLRILSCNLNHVKEPFFTEGLNADWHSNLYYGAGHNEGALAVEMTYTGLELLLHSLMGTYTYSVDTPVAGANTHAFTYAPTTNAHPSVSMEPVTGVGGTKGRIYLGNYVKKVNFEFAQGRIARITFDLVGQGYSVAAPTATSFPTFAPVLPSQKTALTLGGNTISPISGNLEITIARAEGRDHYGETLHKEAVVDGRPTARFNLQCEFDDTANADTEQLLQDYEAGTRIAGLVLTHQGSLVTGATKEELAIASTHANILKSTPTIDGPKVVGVTIEGEILTAVSLTLINGTAQVT